MPRVCSNCGKSIGHIYIIGDCPFCGGKLVDIDEDQAKKEGIKTVFETPLKDFIKENEREFNQLKKIQK